MRFLAAFLALLISTSAMAQTVALISPFPLRGQGNITPTANTSYAITNTMTLTDNAHAFPTAGFDGTLTIKNSPASANPLYVCWQGGVCSIAKGEGLAVGEGATRNLLGQNMTTTPPTVFTVAATVTVIW